MRRFFALFIMALWVSPAHAQDMLGSQAFAVRIGASSSTLVERMRVSNGGLMAIGTASPSTALQVHAPDGGGQTNVFIGKTLQGFESGDVWSGAIYFGVTPTTAIAPTAGIEASWGTSTLPQIHIGTLRDGSPTSVNMYYTGLIRFDVLAKPAMALRYVSAGTSRVGINTTTPVTTLDVAGTLKIANGGEACDASHLGALKYASAKFYMCRSAASGWEEITPGGGGGNADVQTFLASGTWTKPAGGKMTLIECWGAGGGGATAKSGTAGGGGGGAYASLSLPTSQLGASEAVTIGTGGIVGANGGNSTFGSWLTAYGGAKGATSGSGSFILGIGGGGGGLTSAGSGQTGGGPLGTPSYAGGSGSSGGSSGGPGGDSIYSGGGGGGGYAIGTSYATAGGNSIYGAGGGGGKSDGGNGAGGTSWYGGVGGGGSVTGTQPGGGGGGNKEGADGECIVTTY